MEMLEPVWMPPVLVCGLGAVRRQIGGTNLVPYRARSARKSIASVLATVGQRC